MADRKRKRQQHRAEHREQKTSRPAAAPRVTWEIQRGWKVYTADRETLGAVGEVSPADDYFVVSGGFLLRRHTVYVPMRYVRGAGQGRVSLRATKAEALKWRQPPPARRPLADKGDSLSGVPPVRASAPLRVAEDQAPTGSSGAAPERRSTELPTPPITVASSPLPATPVAPSNPEHLSAARAPGGHPVGLTTSTPVEQLSTPLAAPHHAVAPTESVDHQTPAPLALPAEATQAGQPDQADDRSLGEIKAAAVQRFEARLEALVRHDSHEPVAGLGAAMPVHASDLVEITPSPSGGAVQDPQDSATMATETPAD